MEALARDIGALQAALANATPELAAALPPAIMPDAFIGHIKEALANQIELSGVTPASLIAAALQCARHGLLPDGREAGLVLRAVRVARNPDRWERHAIYTPQVEGLMALARRCPEIESLSAEVVYANDRFTYRLGDRESLEHEPAALTADPGAPIAAYAVLRLRDGQILREVLRATTILAISAEAGNVHYYAPESGRNFAEWWRRTAIGCLSRTLPRRAGLEAFIEAAGTIKGVFDFTPAPSLPAAPKKRGAAATALLAMPDAAK